MNPYVAHFVGDFLLQNNWMALNKKCSAKACFVHVILYLVPFVFCQIQWWQIALIGFQHFAQDRTGFVFWWLRFWKKVPEEHWHELPLYVDQTFHILWIEIMLIVGGLS